MLLNKARRIPRQLVTCRQLSTTPCRVLSGIQPTGVPHLGNYLGAIDNWTTLQAEHQGMLCCIVDLHALTVRPSPDKLAQDIMDMATSLLACGIDPAQSNLFLQSDISEHSELMWIFSCFTPLGWLNRMTQYKEKSAGKKDAAGLGLYAYPVLQAADILLYRATDIPVGEDQQQHIELARDIALRFNDHLKQPIFTAPKALFVPDNSRVMSLRNGLKKMSKSDSSDAGRVNLTDTAEVIARKIKKAKTDNLGIIDANDTATSRPEVENLVGIMAAVSGQSVTQVKTSLHGLGMEQVKAAVCESVIDRVCPIGDEIARLRQNRDYVQSVLQDGARSAKEVASCTIRDVKQVVGLGSGLNL